MILRLRKHLQTSLDYTSEETDKIVYILTLFFTDFSKFLILTACFFLLELHVDFIVASVYTMFLRTNTGGFHFKTYKGCLLFSSVYFVFVVSINHFADITSFIVILSIMIIYILAPIIPKERSGIKSIKLKSLKIKSVLLSVVYLSIFLLSANHFTSYGVWVVITQAALLLFQGGKSHVENIQQKKSESSI